MRRSSLWMLGLAFLGANAGANTLDVEVTETVRSVAIAKAEAGVYEKVLSDFEMRCKKLTDLATETLGNRLIYQHCGGRVDGDVGGQSVGGEDTTNYVYGWGSSSEAKILFSVPENYRQLKLAVTGGATTCKVYDTKSCLVERNRALLSYEAACLAWKLDAKAKFGSRFIYAGCGPSKNAGSTSTYGSNIHYRFHSEGTIFYAPN